MQFIDIGDWKHGPLARQLIQKALGRAKVVVANMKEPVTLYCPKESWMKAFAAFRLPSRWSAPTSVSDAASVSDGVRAARAEAAASLKRICEEAKLAAGLACSELFRLLPRS